MVDESSARASPWPCPTSGSARVLRIAVELRTQQRGSCSRPTRPRSSRPATPRAPRRGARDGRSERRRRGTPLPPVPTVRASRLVACPARAEKCVSDQRVPTDIHSARRPARMGGPWLPSALVNEAKTDMVNGTLSPGLELVPTQLKPLHSAPFPTWSRCSRPWPNPRPSPTAPQNERARTLIASAVRTLEAEAGGVTALSAAIHDGLGQAFVAAVELIRSVRGRLIVTGMGKSGHVGRKIAATFASTGTPAYFVHPSEASHGDLGMITADDVIMAISWSGETAELKDLTDYSRRFKIGLIAVTSNRESTLARRRRHRAVAAAGARSLPAQSRADDLDADAAGARRRARDRAPGKPRLHRAEIRRAASGRPARRDAQIRARHHAQRRRRAAGQGSARGWRTRWW